MATFRDLLKQTKHDIREIIRPSRERASTRRRSSTSASSTSTSRGSSRARCSSLAATWRARSRTSSPTARSPSSSIARGARACVTAKTLQDLGYADVVSMLGGSASGRTRVDRGSRPRCSHPSSAPATSATSCCPRSVRPASRSCSRPRCAARRGRSRLARRAVPRGRRRRHIGVVDMDVVDSSNLQRQILHNTERIGDRRSTAPRRRSIC